MQKGFSFSVDVKGWLNAVDDINKYVSKEVTKEIKKEIFILVENFYYEDEILQTRKIKISEPKMKQIWIFKSTAFLSLVLNHNSRAAFF